MKTVTNFAVPRSFLPELQFVLYMERGPSRLLWPFSEFFWTLEHPERGKIVVLLKTRFEQILGAEMSLFSSSGILIKCDVSHILDQWARHHCHSLTSIGSGITVTFILCKIINSFDTTIINNKNSITIWRERSSSSSPCVIYFGMEILVNSSQLHCSLWAN